MDTKSWKIYSASALGKSHIDLGLPCQDFHAFEVRGDWLVAVVCDGAGSAAQSQRGAEASCHGLVNRLIEVVSAAGLDSAREQLASVVASVRDELLSTAAAEGLSPDDFACTVVGVMVGPLQGFLFHVGDGVGIVEFPGGESKPCISAPENGEYANETYFLTDEHWREHLRVTNFDQQTTCIGLMSDGAMPFVMNRSLDDFYQPFIEPVTRYLLANDEAIGSEALGNTLSSENTWAITGDDKTLLLAYPIR